MQTSCDSLSVPNPLRMLILVIVNMIVDRYNVPASEVVGNSGIAGLSVS